ncbi:transglycosylase domain-containing protein [Pandoraea terrae]
MAIVGGLVYAVVQIVAEEAATSRWQSRYLSRVGRDATYQMAPGPSDAIRFPGSGPYDERLGYHALPDYLSRLTQHGFAITEQARMSAGMLSLGGDGLFLPYHEKAQAGLALTDCNGDMLYRQRLPRRVYSDFASVPPVVVASLLYVENRGLLDPEYPTRNPAVDWPRFMLAGTDQLLRFVDPHHTSPGGSTLATQLEKYRHSPSGRTTSPREKIRQMASASVRAYLDGPLTMPSRQHIVLDYLNSVPLSARVGHGEVEGLGDGLWVWYGTDFDELNRLLSQAPGTDESLRHPTEAQARAYKQVLSLIIAQRRPSQYLRQDIAYLDTLTDSYLRLLAAAGTIPAGLRDAALGIRLERATPPGLPAQPSYIQRKAVTGLRTRISSLLGEPSLYNLDRIDLSAASSINAAAQEAVTDQLVRVRGKDGAHAAGLYGFNLLREGDDPSKLMLSVTLYEQRDHANLLRVQADNIDQPFDLNRGARINLGSTAKLRTIVTYLEIIAELYDQYHLMSPAELRALKLPQGDILSRWAADTLAHTPGMTREDLLDAAMDRRYSGNPGEAFFTGGGMQGFENFERWENSVMMPVREAFQHSVNLVFIRLMRDIVRHETYRIHPDLDVWLPDPDSPQRREYVVRFADKEGTDYLLRFYRKYHGLNAAAALDRMLDGRRLTAVRLATALRSVAPDMPLPEFTRQMRARLPKPASAALDDDDLAKLYRKYAQDKFSLNDRGYLSRIHPLELWLVERLSRTPDATFAQLRDDSRDVRQTVYAWLFKTRHKQAQVGKIRRLLEVEAFQEIAKRWRRVGYPFDSLTPSLATAIGASGDRPAALAELVGLIVDDGVGRPMESLRRFTFAQNTPFETRLSLSAGDGTRRLPSDIAGVVRAAMRDVVEGGTARSLRGIFPVQVGGKTGTGDQRFETYGPGGRLIASRVVTRSATFVFFLDDRFFGTVTAFVRAPDAAHFSFTSALAVQLLKSLAPVLSDMSRTGAEAGPLACRD